MALLMRAAVPVTLLAALVGCGFIRDPVAIEATETQYGVFALLTAGSDTASVLVVRFPAAPPPGHDGWEGVPGATVRLVVGTDTVRLEEQAADGRACASGIAGTSPHSAIGCYRAPVPGGIHSGGTIGLVADVPEFGRVLGSATIPDPPTIVAPAEGTRLPADFVNNTWPTVLLRIEAASGTGRLEATLMPRDPARTCEAHFLEGTAGVQGLLALEPDEAANTVVAFRAACRAGNQPEPVGELAAAIRVAAYDSVYARFAEIVFDLDPGALLRPHTRAGIDRGVGYFAGAAAAERRVVLTGGGT